jgi:hypothetical protein
MAESQAPASSTFDGFFQIQLFIDGKKLPESLDIHELTIVMKKEEPTEISASLVDVNGIGLTKPLIKLIEMPLDGRLEVWAGWDHLQPLAEGRIQSKQLTSQLNETDQLILEAEGAVPASKENQALIHWKAERDFFGFDLKRTKKQLSGIINRKGTALDIGQPIRLEELPVQLSNDMQILEIHHRFHVAEWTTVVFLETPIS